MTKAVYWQPEHTIEPLREQVEANLDQKHDLFSPEYLPGPSDNRERVSSRDTLSYWKTPGCPAQATAHQ